MPYNSLYDKGLYVPNIPVFGMFLAAYINNMVETELQKLSIDILWIQPGALI